MTPGINAGLLKGVSAIAVDQSPDLPNRASRYCREGRQSSPSMNPRVTIHSQAGQSSHGRITKPRPMSTATERPRGAEKRLFESAVIFGHQRGGLARHLEVPPTWVEGAGTIPLLSSPQNPSLRREKVHQVSAVSSFVPVAGGWEGCIEDRLLTRILSISTETEKAIAK